MGVSSDRSAHNKVVLSPAAGTSVTLALHYGPKPRRYAIRRDFWISHFLLKNA